MLEAFSFARRLTYCSAISEPTHTITAILVGASFAHVALLLVLMGPLDALTLRYGHCDLTVCAYVDDVELHIVGPEAAAASTWAEGRSAMVLGIVVSRRAKHLGIHFEPGAKTKERTVRKPHPDGRPMRRKDHG